MVKKFYAIAHDQKKNSLLSSPFSSKKRAREFLPLFISKGWTGGIVEVKPPKQLTKREKQEIDKSQEYINRIFKVV